MKAFCVNVAVLPCLEQPPANNAATETSKIVLFMIRRPFTCYNAAENIDPHRSFALAGMCRVGLVPVVHIAQYALKSYRFYRIDPGERALHLRYEVKHQPERGGKQSIAIKTSNSEFIVAITLIVCIAKGTCRSLKEAGWRRLKSP